MLPPALSPMARMRSIGHALVGVVRLLGSQANAQLHLLATLLVVAAGVYWSVSAVEWALLAVAIGAVWALEAMNTAIEALCDKIESRQDPAIGFIKDVAAAGVLFGALMAIAVGLAVFLPHWLA